jgi:uncharacterized membrane protein
MRYQIIVGKRAVGGDPNKKTGSLWARLKSGLVALVVLSVIIGAFIAAFTLGLVIAVLIIVFMIGALLVGFFSYAWHRKAR